jgi:MFS family permease
MASTDPAVDYIEGREGFSRFQVVAITLCALVNVVDGFDVLAIAFTAPAISTEWSLSPGRLGVVFSAGYLGMALGAFFLGALADKFGSCCRTGLPAALRLARC